MLQWFSICTKYIQTHCMLQWFSFFYCIQICIGHTYLFPYIPEYEKGINIFLNHYILIIKSRTWQWNKIMNVTKMIQDACVFYYLSQGLKLIVMLFKNSGVSICWILTNVLSHKLIAGLIFITVSGSRYYLEKRGSFSKRKRNMRHWAR